MGDGDRDGSEALHCTTTENGIAQGIRFRGSLIPGPDALHFTQVVEFNPVAIDERQMANPHPRKMGREHGPGPTAPNNGVG